MFISQFLKKDISRAGVFDALLEKDSNFYINVVRLRMSSMPEFVEAYDYMNRFFAEIAALLEAADEPDKKRDKMYREARNRFVFHEVNGINLGLSETGWGAGWGKTISDRVLKDAFQIVKKGSVHPEIFHRVALFEENVASDRMSDMVATIIEPYIKKYTKRIMLEYLHGFETQIHEYAKAENVRIDSNLIYVYIDLGNPQRTKKIKQLAENAKGSGKPYPELVVIDARGKKSASLT